MTPRWKRYKRELDHSYAFGVYPTLELLEHRPDRALGVLIRSKGESNEGIEKIRLLSDRLEIPIALDDRGIERLGARPNDYAVGVFAKGSDRLDPAADQIVLVGPSGMGNLGTVMRTMVGFGLHDLAIVEPAADPYDPQTVRASMGALFHLRFEPFAEFDAVPHKASRVFYPLMTDGEHRFDEIVLERPCSLVFGSESSGLDDSFRKIGTSIAIPQSDEIDSLNLAVAVGIGAYEVARARGAKPSGRASRSVASP
jgi:TrmH family RNA methyltransferase